MAESSFRPVDEKQQANEGTENSTNTRNAHYQPDQNCSDGCDHFDLTSFVSDNSPATLCYAPGCLSSSGGP
jgi:hypothetical protein